MKKLLRLFLCCLFLSFGLFADQDQFGLCTHNFPIGNSDASKNYFKQLNVKWIRGGVDWFDIEFAENLAPDQWAWWNPDKIVTYAQKNNINILGGLGGVPTFYGRNDKTTNYLDPKYIDKWTRYVTLMVERYDGDGIDDMPGLTKPIKYWEIWNEPNLGDFWAGTRQEFVDNILDPGIAAIRAAYPEAKICGPGLSNLGYDNIFDDRDAKFWLRYITSRIGVVFDILTHHPYHDNSSKSINQLTDFYNLADNLGYGERDFWVTEIGWEVSNPNAKEYMRGIFDSMLANKNWWKKTFWYAWIDPEYYLIDNNDVRSDLYYTFKNYTNPPSVTVVSPNGGESWAKGSTQTIRWTSNDVTDLQIELWRGITFNTIITDSTPASTGFYNWTIPATQKIGTGYKILISSNIGYIIDDFSNAPFTISDSVPPTVTVTSPNGGENWTVGSTHNITWNSTGTIANVKFECSTNNGSTWNNIVGSPINDGSQPWTIPNTPSTQCRVRITDSANPSVTDSSNAPFTISGGVPNKPNLNSPADNAWVCTTTPTFTWNAVTATPAVDYYQLKINNADGSKFYESALTPPGEIKSTSFTLPVANKLQNKKTYKWYVRAHNYVGWGDWSTGRTLNICIAPPVLPSGCGTINAGYGLGVGQKFNSCDGRFRLQLQSSGNLVLYQGITPLWASNTENTAIIGVYMQGDGNLVLATQQGVALWTSETNGHPGSRLVIQNDGNMVIYTPQNTKLWSTNTGGK